MISQEEDESEDPEASKYQVKNTFIDTPLQRSPSLEKFVGIRRVNSSPPAMFEELCKEVDPFGVLAANTPTNSNVAESEAEAQVAADVSPRRRLMEELACTDNGSASDLGGSTRAGTAIENPNNFSAGSGQISVSAPADATARSGAAPAAAAGADGSGSAAGSAGMAVVASSTSGADEEDAVVGSAEMPSRGSALHKVGACKPCAFVSHGVCRNDVNCPFCHLCEPGEKKRRRKEWLETKRAARRQIEVVAPQQAVVHPQTMYHPGFGCYVTEAMQMPGHMYPQQQMILVPQASVYMQPEQPKRPAQQAAQEPVGAR